MNELAIKAYELRKDVISMVYNASSGHIGGALGMADVMTYLYFNEMNYKSKQPNWSKRDYFFLSNGHTCPILYACLAEAGFFKKEELYTYRKLNSRLQGHPHAGSLPGIENSGGPLGQGISQAVGLAAILKREEKENRVFCYVGDGELEEGVCWEALLFAQKEKLDNLIIIIDRNNMQIDGTTKDVINLDNIAKKCRGFGCRVIEFDAHNFNQIHHVFKEGIEKTGKPTCLLAKSIPGKGVSFMEKDFHWHGKAPKKEEYNLAIDEINTHIDKLRGEIK